MAAAPFEFVQVGTGLPGGLSLNQSNGTITGSPNATGNVVDDEGLHGWQQMCKTAIKKEPQYSEGFPNILVFVNHSNSLDLQLRSAVNEFDDEVRKAGASSPLRKLGGMMILKAHSSVGWNATNVEFCYTRHALHVVHPQFVNLMTQGQIA